MRNEGSEMDEGFFSFLSDLWKKVKSFVQVKYIGLHVVWNNVMIIIHWCVFYVLKQIIN